jgi:hypothetical protein
MNADLIVLEHLRKSSGLLDRLFGRPEDYLEAAVKTFGDDMVVKAAGLADEIQREMARSAAAHGVNPDYLHFAIFRMGTSWPVSGKLADALTLAKDLVLEGSRPPSMSRLTLDQDEEAVDAAVRSVAQWAATELKKKLHTLLWQGAAKHAKSLIRKLKQNVTPVEMSKYLILKTSEAVSKSNLIFSNSYLLNAIFKLVG